MAVVKVGAATESEMKEKKTRIEDALAATRSAVEEGIIPGGGACLVHCIPVLDKIKADADEMIGVNIVRRALEEPLRQIAVNGGYEGSVIVEKVKSSPKGVGFNVLSGKYEDMIKSGIVDPAKVTRSALQNAASISGILLTTEVLISEKPSAKESAPPMGGHGHPGMGGMM